MVREEKEIQKKSLRFGGGLWRHSSEHPYRQAERLICCHQDPRRLERVVLMYRYSVICHQKKVNSIFPSLTSPSGFSPISSGKATHRLFHDEERGIPA